MQETKKAFRNIFKRGSLESAAQALCNLKGVGPTMASGIDRKNMQVWQIVKEALFNIA